MAITFSLTRGATTLNLNNQNPGFTLLGEGWIPVVATDDVPVTETMTFIVRGSSQDNLATQIQALTAMQKWTDEYMKNAWQATPVWLNVKMASETGARRALVRKIAWKQNTGYFDAYAQIYQAEVVLQIEREPFWEQAAVDALDTTASLALTSLVNYFDYTADAGADVDGDMPARISGLEIQVGGNAAGLERIWAGFRSTLNGVTLANLGYLWELEDGTITAVETSRVTDATASPGSGDSIVRCATGYASWSRKLYITAGTGSGSAADQIGNYLWLLRGKVSAGEWEVQFRWGYGSLLSAELVVSPAISFTETSYTIKEIGVCAIPPMPKGFAVDGGASLTQNFQLDVYARQISGAGTFDLDCVILIPLDEGYFIASNACDGTAATLMLQFSEAPEGQVSGYTVSTVGSPSAIRYVPIITSSEFRVPIGDGRLIIVGARDTTSVFGDDTGVDRFEIFPRWRSLRGAD